MEDPIIPELKFPDPFNTGDEAWVLASTALVFLMLPCVGEHDYVRCGGATVMG